MKKYKVYTQDGYDAEKFYIQDHEEQDVIFEADSIEDVLPQARDYIIENSLFDVEATDEWISMQDWHVVEV